MLTSSVILAGWGCPLQQDALGTRSGRKRLTGDLGLRRPSAQLPSGEATLLHLSNGGAIRTGFVAAHEDENELVVIYRHAEN